VDPILSEFALVGSDLKILRNVKITIDQKHQITQIEELDRNITNRKVVMPGLFNAHVHAADLHLRGVKSKDLGSLVGRNGIKHKYLLSLSQEQLQNSLRQAVDEAIKLGTLGWSDFREGGVKGIQYYPIRGMTNFLAFGRPDLSDLNDLSQFDHLGIMDVQAYSEIDMKHLANQTNRNKQKIFIHGSESLKLRKEWISKFGVSDIIWALDILKPDAIIHATHANEQDLELMEDTSTGVIICIRSNKFTNSGVPPVELLVNSNLKLGLGSDNAMFQELSIWNEMTTLMDYIDPDRLLRMASIEGAEICGIDWGINIGNSNFIELSIPNSVTTNNLKNWLVATANEKFINRIWVQI
jgi:cytosine/adenosine deaminase-related metal-dependent hydrolase